MLWPSSRVIPHQLQHITGQQLFYTNIWIEWEWRTKNTLLQFSRGCTEFPEFSMFREIPEYSRFVATLLFYPLVCGRSCTGFPSGSGSSLKWPQSLSKRKPRSTGIPTWPVTGMPANQDITFLHSSSSTSTMRPPQSLLVLSLLLHLPSGTNWL